MTLPPLIVIPGIGSDEAFWFDQPKAMLIQSAAETIEDMAADTLEQCPREFALAGHSLGGYIALAMMALEPRRVAGLALLNTSAQRDTSDQSARRVLLIERARLNFDSVAEDLSGAMIARSGEPALRMSLSEMIRRTGAPSFIRQQIAAMNRQDQTRRLAAIKVPTTVITGAQDRIVSPELTFELSLGITGSRFVRLENCGHSPALEQPIETRSILETWLQSL